MSFEENLLDLTLARRIRDEHIRQRLTLHAIAVRHGLPYATVKKVVQGKLYGPEAPLPEELRFLSADEPDEQTQVEG